MIGFLRDCADLSVSIALCVLIAPPVMLLLAVDDALRRIRRRRHGRASETRGDGSPRLSMRPR